MEVTKWLKPLVGRTNKAPPDESGGNRYVRPKSHRATSRLYQSRSGPADGRSGYVGYPPIATDFSGASNFAMCQQAT
jgi:hypothetical protein